MEDEAILEGFSNFMHGSEYDALYEAALCRERADWIVGINAIKLFSTLYHQTLNVGRVMTPTLAMAVEITLILYSTTLTNTIFCIIFIFRPITKIPALGIYVAYIGKVV